MRAFNRTVREFRDVGKRDAGIGCFVGHSVQFLARSRRSPRLRKATGNELRPNRVSQVNDAAKRGWMATLARQGDAIQVEWGRVMNWKDMLFHDWDGIIRILVVGTLAYVTLVLFLRISGKRTLAKLNAFDLVVTVALGSTLATVLLQKSVPLAEGAVALALLILLQFAVAFLSVRLPTFAKLVRSEPTLLARKGAFCQKSMTRSRITQDEALSAIRSSGGRTLGDVETLILESDGTISVSLRSNA